MFEKMQIDFIKKAEKREIIEQLSQQFGISEIPFLLLRSGKERIRAYSGSLSKDEILEFNKTVNIEAIGLYFARQSPERENTEIRLSTDAIHLLREQINKGIIELNREQTEDWFRGKDIFIENKSLKGFVILKNKDNFVGCGKIAQDRILNFLPKERRIKN